MVNGGMHLIFNGIKSFLKVFMLGLLLCSPVAWSNAGIYIGADILYAYSDFKEDYGRDIFNSNNERQYNGFVGYYFSNLFGFEVGYEKNITKHSMTIVPPGSTEFGVKNFTAIASNVYDTTQSAYQYNFNYVPQIQITSSISVIGVIGLSYVKAQDNMNLTKFDDATASTAEQNNYDLTFNATKAIPRFGFRVQYMLTRMLGLRASYIWENTDALTLKAIRNINPNQTLEAKLSNSSSVGLGLLLKF